MQRLYNIVCISRVTGEEKQFNELRDILDSFTIDKGVDSEVYPWLFY